MPDPNGALNFEADVLPYLDLAYNLARWLTRKEQDAEDVVREAFMRAFRFLGGFRGGNTRAWLLGIVRNTCYTFLQHNRQQPREKEGLGGGDPSSGLDGYRCAAVIPRIPRGLSVFTSCATSPSLSTSAR